MTYLRLLFDLACSLLSLVLCEVLQLIVPPRMRAS